MTDIHARMLAKLAFVVTQIKKNGIKLPFAFCLLPFAFCLLPFAFCLLPPEFSQP
ncbi:hypothetical protein IQ224_22605 [Microcystis sp. LEGE 00066]|uniref:hypothetical protein n=1 Tax=Microcystis aeruginosa TaxID=1126 RepID=UPI0013747CB0|nr:hypothetical protein [Microcystis aeruginosa]MBE9264764.1 hypothetical protein [Microcystis sp. LEGE 00066]UGS07814.1 hypothetical protein LRR78_16430 [Microcystis aeruginosa FACHB-905 = DIANCHI905]WKX63887.1 hypothetical protein Q3H53_004058 [Microcystis aeruginosa PCC 7806]